jgi:hypothetical protein
LQNIFVNLLRQASDVQRSVAGSSDGLHCVLLPRGVFFLRQIDEIFAVANSHNEQRTWKRQQRHPLLR